MLYESDFQTPKLTPARRELLTRWKRAIFHAHIIWSAGEIFLQRQVEATESEGQGGPPRAELGELYTMAEWPVISGEL